MRAPRANAIAERFVGTPRCECLDHLLITGPRHLAAVLREFVEHYNTHRPHRSLDQRPPADPIPPRSGAAVQPLSRDRVDGLIHEYVQVALRPGQGENNSTQWGATRSKQARSPSKQVEFHDQPVVGSRSRYRSSSRCFLARMTLAAATEAGRASTLSDDCHRLEPEMDPQLENEGSSAVEE